MSTTDSPASLDPDLAIELVPPVVESLANWQISTGYRLHLEKWLTTGHTRAKVAVALARRSGSFSRLIIKFCPPDRLTAREPRLLAEALAKSPAGFRQEHLVEMPFGPIQSEDNWRILFQSIAGQSLRNIRPLESVMRDDRLPGIVETIASALLLSWNDSFESRRIEPQSFLKQELGSKADRNGPLMRYSKDHSVSDEQWLRFPDYPAMVTPNAIAWSFHADFWPSAAESFWAHFGHVHGDLHPGNVLISVDPTPDGKDFRLIDMSNYTSSGSIIRDVTHLALSILGEHYLNTPDRRRELFTIALGDTGQIPLELHGLRAIMEAVDRATNDWLSKKAPGMRDDWDDQKSIALVTEALEFVGRSSLADSKRMWFFQLACTALGRHLTRHGLGTAPEDPATVQVLGRIIDSAVEDTVQRLLEACENFTSARSLLCIVPRDLAAEASNRLSRWPWTAVISFDPSLDTTGALKTARTSGERLDRLVTMGQVAQFSHDSTTWLALGGLIDIPGTMLDDDDPRAWRRAYKKTIDESLSNLARFSSRPLTTVIFGNPDSRVRTVVEAIDDRFGDRAQTLLVNIGQASLEGFVDQYLQQDPSDIVAALPDYDAAIEASSAIPGHEGPVIVGVEDQEWIRELADLVDMQSGTSAGEIDDVGRGFLRGRQITWFELSLGLDAVPSIARNLVSKLRDEIAARDTRRISLLHYPGAGGTTLARRAAWEMHREVPTLYCPVVRDVDGLAQRISRLSQLANLPVLVVLEQTTDLVADRLYNRLRSDSVPVVLLIVSRRTQRPQQSGGRSFYLGTLSTVAEVSDLALRYGEYAPRRLHELESIRPGQPWTVPFYFGLVAFEDGYQGLQDYVRHATEYVAGTDRNVLLATALIHRYAGTSIAADYFAVALDVPSNRAVRLERSVGDAALGLLIEEEPGFWRTAHWLVAGEVVRQLLLPPGAIEADAWKMALSGTAMQVIDEAARVFGSELPDDIRDVLDRLFIVRENREGLDEPRLRQFSELLEDIPVVNGRLAVLKRLAETFPDEAHYWAHYGRLLSYAVGDTGGALEALNKALTLDDSDSVLYHIRGIIYLRKIRNFSREPEESFNENELHRLAGLALADFDEAIRIKDDSEYPHVAVVQVAVAVIETAYRRSGASSHSEFLARPTSSSYRSLVERAEAAVDAMAEIDGGDQPSARVEEVNVELNALYDDYTALLQGWRNLLVRQDINKVPVRRRLVRAYYRRAGDWAKLGRADRERVRVLLEENLQDDPTDSVSLRDWLRVARLDTASIDRASELVSYWASQSTSRDALYYDYVLAVLQVLEGRDSIRFDAQRKIERCRDRAASFGNRRFSYEWLGHGSGLGMLVHHADLPQVWDRNSSKDVPPILRRVSGRVARIGSPQAGTLRLNDGGLDAFFVPAAAGVMRNRHENALVDAVIGFSYDGLRAWSVRLTGDDS
jgi:tetratricopeptide (TPR) repeat protein